MSYIPSPPNDPRNWRLDEAQEMIGREEAYAAEQRLAREAEEANGGTPGEKIMRRLKAMVGIRSAPPSRSD